MLTSDHTRYRVKYLKRFKGAPPKIAVQRTITYLENTNHPLTEIHFKTLDVIDITRVFRGHKLTVDAITLEKATDEFHRLFDRFLGIYGIKFDELEIRLHNHSRKSPYLAVRPKKGRMALIGCVRIPIVQPEPVRPNIEVFTMEELDGHVIKNIWMVTDNDELLSASEITEEQLEYCKAILFHREDDNVVEMYHSRECCETVYLSDIDGDLSDIVGEKILDAEERTEESTDNNWQTQWTFYHIRTRKGCVVMRWCGDGSIYYSVDVCVRVRPFEQSVLAKPERIRYYY